MSKHDLSRTDDTLRTVIGAPGFKDKRNITHLIADAEHIGLVRHSSNSSLPFHLRTGEKLYYEAFLNGRLFQIRATASKDLSPQDYDTGHVHNNTVWIIFGSRSCRYFEIDLSPVPAMGIWMIPSFNYRGYGYFATGGELVSKHGFPEGNFEFPSNNIVDYLWALLEDAEDGEDLVMLAEPVSRLRLMFVDQIVNHGCNGMEPPDIEMPPWKGWNRQIIRRAWGHARLLVDPLYQVRHA